jgi:hypothetical protein
VGSNQQSTWTGAIPLSGKEDHATGVATDGDAVVFSTGGSQVGENAVRLVPFDGSSASSIIVANPLGLIPSGALAIDRGDVYVGAGRSILRFALGGGDVTEIVSARPATVTALAVDETHVFWTTADLNRPDDAQLARSPKTGGGPIEVLADHVIGHGSYSALALDGVGGAYAASPGGIVHGRPGRAAAVLVSAEQASGAVTQIAFDGDRLYGVVAGGRNDLFTVTASGGDMQQLARHADSVKSIIPVAGGVAFFDRNDLRYVSSTGGAATTLASGPYADGALCAVGDVLIFPADWQIWTTTVPR